MAAAMYHEATFWWFVNGMEQQASKQGQHNEGALSHHCPFNSTRQLHPLSSCTSERFKLQPT
eukprot:1529272-Rhodomonas_salina.1